MSAEIMSNYYSSQFQVQNWMLAQMSHYPPPPQPDQQHYHPIGYPTSAGAQQLVEPGSQDQLQYSNLNQSIYPKIESTTPGQDSNQQVHNLAQELQQHALQEEQQRQHIQQAAQQIQQQAQQSQQGSFTDAPHTHPQQQQQQQQQQTSEQQKTNRLRKACDSCSIRKVKVCSRASHIQARLELVLTIVVRRDWSTVPSMFGSRHTMHIRETKSPAWSTQSACRSHQKAPP